MSPMMRVVEPMPHAASPLRGEAARVDGRSRDASALALRARLMEVEAEHLRLQRLVAELLIKNQKLRELLCEQAGSSAAAASVCRGEGGSRQGQSSSQ